MGVIKRTIKLTQYQMKLRKALGNASIEELRLTLEETKKEIEKRNRQK